MPSTRMCSFHLLTTAILLVPALMLLLVRPVAAGSAACCRVTLTAACFQSDTASCPLDNKADDTCWCGGRNLESTDAITAETTNDNIFGDSAKCLSKGVISGGRKHHGGGKLSGLHHHAKPSPVEGERKVFGGMVTDHGENAGWPVVQDAEPGAEEVEVPPIDHK
ncbi:hypothetical protein BDZ90DRAFT_262845 [Jaminaea rosea]|uniref:Extracellular membrane protein CFEM domain-containing protein n=1 Tax=Jaminaea rosea TaxID=1569628 RepID=A0A316UI90_9BASI|nr:hypothetical protein BDZ90DRAFT_262845 [Jaminaea rosea]PWN24992.1 hypothetical protein BDZ90DRAFT_262845 [Jaminaea rosea]